MVRVKVAPELLIWARERADIAQEELIKRNRLAHLSRWKSGELQPTLRQLELFANAVHVPIGYLFLKQPPLEPLPIPDFRTCYGKDIRKPSLNLLDTIYACQNRQDWYREFSIYLQESKHDFVGQLNLSHSTKHAATLIRKTLKFDLELRQKCTTPDAALRLLIRQVEEVGILVMVSGVVGNNNHRPLNPKEFRGFALSDSYAPLIFVNGADAKAAQIFTLAHELAHLWLGDSGLSNFHVNSSNNAQETEVWCNAVAGEFLVPTETLNELLNNGHFSINEGLGQVTKLARHFKVSTLVILRRLLDTGWLNRTTFEHVWAQEHGRFQAASKKKPAGGNFCNTALSRVGRRFANALIVSTLEGQTPYRDAFRMLAIEKTATFNKLSQELDLVT